MDIEEKMKELCGVNRATYLALTEPDVYNDFVARCQNAFDHPDPLLDAFPWMDNSPEGRAVRCAHDLDRLINDEVIALWLREFSREEILTLRDLLLRGPADPFLKITIMDRLTPGLPDILRKWNDLHPDQAPVYMPDPDI